MSSIATNLLHELVHLLDSNYSFYSIYNSYTVFSRLFSREKKFAEFHEFLQLHETIIREKKWPLYLAALHAIIAKRIIACGCN